MAQKRFMHALAGAVFACAAATGAASASSLSSANLFAPADALLTRDSLSGLEWLDLTATAGRSKIDVLDAGADVDGFGNDWLDLGFVYATIDQVTTLWLDHGFTVIDGGYAAANTLALFDSFVDLLGETTAPNGTTRLTQGYVSEEPPPTPPGGTFAPRMIYDSQGDGGNPGTLLDTSSAFANFLPSGDYGSWLVRAYTVTEPMTLGLFAVGLLGLGLAARRTHKARG